MDQLVPEEPLDEPVLPNPLRWLWPTVPWLSDCVEDVDELLLPPR